jgi:hypothetical protein
MFRVSFKHASVSHLGIVIIFLLLVNVPYLEPNVFFCQRWRWYGNDVPETLETLRVFLLLLVDYTKAKVDFIGLFKVRLHAHNLRKGLFSMLQRAIAIIENANPIP